MLGQGGKSFGSRGNKQWSNPSSRKCTKKPCPEKSLRGTGAGLEKKSDEGKNRKRGTSKGKDNTWEVRAGGRIAQIEPLGAGGTGA